jgi:hypothetical protein
MEVKMVFHDLREGIITERGISLGWVINYPQLSTGDGRDFHVDISNYPTERLFPLKKI